MVCIYIYIHIHLSLYIYIYMQIFKQQDKCRPMLSHTGVTMLAVMTLSNDETTDAYNKYTMDLIVVILIYNIYIYIYICLHIYINTHLRTKLSAAPRGPRRRSSRPITSINYYIVNCFKQTIHLYIDY